MGNILLISSTTSFTIIFNAILSPIVLGEKFRWKIDGVTIMMLATGSSIAVAQQPSQTLSMPSSDTYKFVSDHLMKQSTMILFGIMLSLIVMRMKLGVLIQSELSKFYKKTMMTYEFLREQNGVS